MTDEDHEDHEDHKTPAPPPVHPAIQLLVARMESHPKEFWLNHYSPAGGITRNTNAMLQAIEPTKGTWNRIEKELFNRALREARLHEAHERLMHLLLKGK